MVEREVETVEVDITETVRLIADNGEELVSLERYDDDDIEYLVRLRMDSSTVILNIEDLEAIRDFIDEVLA